MAYGKWIGAWLGWISSQSVLGALAGFALGAVFEAMTTSKSKNSKDNLFFSDINSNDRSKDEHDFNGGNRNSFLFSLMVLAAHVIQADGKIMHSEMEMVRGFLRVNFGEHAVEQGNEVLLKLFDYRKRNGEEIWNRQMREACQDMGKHMELEHRLQLIAFLCDIAKSDGRIANAEIEALQSVAVNMMLSANVVEQLLHLGGDSLEDAYAVLGVSKDATNEEIRKAYRNMALQYHPDRVATLGDDVKNAAQKKFQEINNAKEKIYKERGIG